MSDEPAATWPPLSVGIDVGGTKVALGIVGVDGELGSTARIENRDADGPGDLLAWVAESARQMAANAPGGKIAAVGVGLPELVDLQGEVRSTTSIPWTRPEVLEAFGDIAPVVVEADVRAAALAEAHFGAGRGYRTLGFVTVGTGISSCLVLEGVPYVGAHGTAQLLGSAPVTLPCPHCGASFRASLEDLAPGPVLVERFNERTGSAIGGAEELFAAAERGDWAAVEILKESAEVLGSFVALFVNIVDPDAVVLGGGLGTAGGVYWDAVVRSAREHIWAEHARALPITRAALGANAGVVGTGYGALRALGLTKDENG